MTFFDGYEWRSLSPDPAPPADEEQPGKSSAMSGWNNNPTLSDLNSYDLLQDYFL